MLFRQIFDEHLAQYAYLVGCQQTGEALLIDPERDIDRYIDIARKEDLTITAVTETHIHADFLSGARAFAEHGTKVYLSDEGDADWKYQWANKGDYDVTLLQDGDTFRIGNIEIKAVHTPGHTPEHIAFLITDHGGGADEPMGLASGDFVFVGDLGRPDLLESAAGQVGAQEPAARHLYASVQDFLQLPDYLQVWPGHGAGSACGKALGAVPETTVGYEKRFNASIDAAKRGEAAFVAAILEGQPEPPLYFGRMKKLNKQGPPLLDALPHPAPITADQLKAFAGRTDIALVDTRPNRSAFMQHHVPGALYAPFDKTFPTVTGSYIEPDLPIYLIISAEHVAEAVRNLVRIGLDNVAGYATFETLEQHAAQGGNLISTKEIDITDLDAARGQDGIEVLDVRRQSEFETGHVPGSQNIAHTRLLERLDEIPKDKQLWVHCRSGARSAVAAAMLERAGYNVVYVNGLIDDWRATHEPEIADVGA